MANLVAGSSPRNQTQAIVLAEAYTELGDIVGHHFSAKEATDAHFEAIKVLLELLRLDPDWPEANYLLARNYGEVAGLERDAGNNNEAVRKKQDAIQIMGEVVANDPGNPRYHYHKAKLRGELAELMNDLGKAKEALPIIKESITALEALLKTAGPAMTAERKEWEVQLALLYGILGQASETAKQKELARKSFKTAEAQWIKLSEVDKTSDVIQQGLSWTRNRLQKLK
jgi:tetratricopeptide (TPR) repeat protein